MYWALQSDINKTIHEDNNDDDNQRTFSRFSHHVTITQVFGLSRRFFQAEMIDYIYAFGGVLRNPSHYSECYGIDDMDMTMAQKRTFNWFCFILPVQNVAFIMYIIKAFTFWACLDYKMTKSAIKLKHTRIPCQFSHVPVQNATTDNYVFVGNIMLMFDAPQVYASFAQINTLLAKINMGKGIGDRTLYFWEVREIPANSHVCLSSIN